MSVRKWLGGGLVLGVLASGTVWTVEHHLTTVRERDRRAATATARAYLAAWNARRYDDMVPLTAADPAAGDSYRNLAERLKATSVTVTETSVSVDGKKVTFHAVAQLQGLGPLTWDDELHLTKTGRGARVAFTSGTVFPGLANGEVLARSTPVVTCGDIQDRHGVPVRPASADLAANVLGHAFSPQSGLERVYDARLTGT